MTERPRSEHLASSEVPKVLVKNTFIDVQYPQPSGQRRSSSEPASKVEGPGQRHQQGAIASSGLPLLSNDGGGVSGGLKAPLLPVRQTPWIHLADSEAGSDIPSVESTRTPHTDAGLHPAGGLQLTTMLPPQGDLPDMPLLDDVTDQSDASPTPWPRTATPDGTPYASSSWVNQVIVLLHAVPTPAPEVDATRYDPYGVDSVRSRTGPCDKKNLGKKGREQEAKNRERYASAPEAQQGSLQAARRLLFVIINMLKPEIQHRLSKRIRDEIEVEQNLKKMKEVCELLTRTKKRMEYCYGQRWMKEVRGPSASASSSSTRPNSGLDSSSPYAEDPGATALPGKSLGSEAHGQRDSGGPPSRPGRRQRQTARRKENAYAELTAVPRAEQVRREIDEVLKRMENLQKSWDATFSEDNEQVHVLDEDLVQEWLELMQQAYCKVCSLMQ